MLIKKSPKNQIAIPKSLLEKAGLSREDLFFDIDYRYGMFVLQPLTFEEKVPIEQIRRFEEWAKTSHQGDKSFPSMNEAILHLKKRIKRSKKKTSHR